MASNSTHTGAWHTFDYHGEKFTVPIRYQDTVFIGQSSLGIVVRAIDTITGKQVAIKKLTRTLNNPMFAKQIYRELKLLMYLNHPDAQIVQLYNVFTSEKTLEEFQTLYFVFNFAGFELYHVIKSNTEITERHIKLIIYQILRSLKFIHSAGIIHRDLKPSKLGIDQSANVTILDFGLAPFLWAGNSDWEEYVSARWWCAPEININPDHCDDKVDVWSVGCIMGELIRRQPIFRGTDRIDQLNKILDIVGTPDAATLNEICVPNAARYISNLPSRPKQDLNQLFGFKYDAATETPISGVSPQGIDLLDRLLSFDPRKRPTAAEALAHPFFGDLHDPTDEPTIDPLVEEHHDANHSIEMWKFLIWQMIEEFEPPPWINDESDED